MEEFLARGAMRRTDAAAVGRARNGTVCRRCGQRDGTTREPYSLRAARSAIRSHESTRYVRSPWKLAVVD